jgi:hypothetical protein
MTKKTAIRFARIYPRIWSDENLETIISLNRELLGLVFYLRTNKSFNMIGLYPLSISQVKRELRYKSYDHAEHAIRQICETGYCKYCFDSEYVFVINMAEMQSGDMVNEKQRCGIHNILVRLHEEGAPFIDDFIELYGDLFSLSKDAIERDEYGYVELQEISAVPQASKRTNGEWKK